MRPLSDKQKVFANRYLLTGNATQSYIDAGYSKKAAYSESSRLLKKDHIQKYIQSNREKVLESKNIAKLKEIQIFLTDILHDNTVNLKYRLQASYQLMKSQGAFEFNNKEEKKDKVVFIKEVV